jgi:starch phosphorylase
MHEAVTDKWWPFAFGGTAAEIQDLRDSNGYHAGEYYRSNPKFKRIVDTLRDRTFANTDSEHQAFSDIFHKLVEGHYGGAPDRYFTLYDLESYMKVQKSVEDLYLQPHLWAQYAMENIAAMGAFSSDVSVKKYCEEIWDLTPVPIDEEVLERVRHEYSVLDVCRVYK